MDSTQNIISFCTGYGGLDLGLKRVWPDSRTVAYVEIEAFAIANLVAKMEQGKLDSAPVWSNLKTFDGRPFRGKVHGITAGYPCQPFSNAGKRLGEKDPRHLWPYIEEHIRTIEPLWCWFENVGGHLNLGFDEVYKSLRDLGYQVEAILVTAAEIGAPHLRERLFILAYTVRSGTRNPCIRNRVQWKDIQQDEFGDRNEVRSNITGSCKLAYTNTGQGRPATITQPTETQQPESGDDSGEMGDSDSQPGRVHTKGRLSDTKTRPASKELADSEKLRVERRGQAGNALVGEHGEEALPCGCCERTRWPARPGQEQYDWEEPRTVKSGMGRTIDGFASRVDELRLLGNGVVPQQAELALSSLLSRLYE